MIQPAMSGPPAGLILAGGASSRMGTPKALLRVGDKTFIDHLIGLFHRSTQPVLVVLGHDAELVRHGIESRTPLTFAVNPQPERGMLSSLQCGLRELAAKTAAVIFSPVDYPNFQAATLARIAETFLNNACDVVVPVCLGVRGHPVCISRRVIDELITLPETGQARDVIRLHRDTTIFLEVDDPGIAADVDTPDDYRALVSGSQLPIPVPVS